MYIVCCTTTKDNYEFHDSYWVFETLVNAKVWYKKLLESSETHTASLCEPIESTEPHYLYKQSVNKLKKG